MHKYVTIKWEWSVPVKASSNLVMPAGRLTTEFGTSVRYQAAVVCSSILKGIGAHMNKGRVMAHGMIDGCILTACHQLVINESTLSVIHSCIDTDGGATFSFIAAC